DLRGTEDQVVQTVSCPQILYYKSVLWILFGALLDRVQQVRVEREAEGRNLLEARLAERLGQVVPDHADSFASFPLKRIDRRVHFVEDGQESRQERFVGESDDDLGVAVRPLPVVLELRLQVLELRQKLLVLAPEGFSLVRRLHGRALVGHPSHLFLIRIWWPRRRGNVTSSTPFR